MFKIACFGLAFVAATPLWAQVQPSASGSSYDQDDEHMTTPPPVSQQGYPATARAEERSNFLSGGLVVTAAYADNLMVITKNGSTSDEIYSFVPTVSLGRKTARNSESLNYSSGFTLYQNTSELNAITQSGSADYQFHISRYATLRMGDTFQQNNNLYNQGNPFVAGGVSGAPGSSSTALIEPFANQLQNSSSAGVEYQYAKNAMIGASGSYSFLQFSQVSNISGLSNENSAGGSAFFSRRIGRSYTGVTYQFSKFVTHPIGSYTVANTIFGFYTHYFTPSFSISLLGGPERYTSWSALEPKSAAWTPAVQGSIGWQTLRANLAASYSHIVSGAGGLIGTFHSDVGSLSAEKALSRNWSVGVNGTYMLYKNLSSLPVQFGLYPGGHTVSGGVNLQRRITESLTMEAGYQRLHLSYSGITVTSVPQDSDRGSVSIMYGFNRPLGR